VVEEVKDYDVGTADGADYWTRKCVFLNSTLKFAAPAHIAADVLSQKARSCYM
jgi:hypothetical protein